MDRRNVPNLARTNIVPLRYLDAFDDEPDAPEPVVYRPNCSCTVCQAFTSPIAMGHLELDIMDLVADLLDHGWAPEELVDEVEALARRGPFAGQIVTLALVSHAGYWLSDPTMDETVDDLLDDLLDDIDELAAGFHHLVGLVVPGWLDRWARNDVDIESALAGIRDVLETLPVLPCPLPTPKGGVARVSIRWAGVR